MTDLIAFLSTGKGSWSTVTKVISGERWGKVILLTNEFGKEKFNPSENTELVVLDMNKSSEKLAEDIISSLKGKIDDLEVGVNLSSGSGKEHMALITALVKMGLGFRLVDFDDSIKHLI